MKRIQKLIVAGTLIAVVGMVAWAADEPATKTDTSYDKLLDQKVTEVWFDCQKIHPGMTRADLDKMFRRETGGVAVPESMRLPFREHQTFDYRRCDHIMIDVDFRPSDSKEERPTDVITRVSDPYINCSPRGSRMTSIARAAGLHLVQAQIHEAADSPIVYVLLLPGNNPVVFETFDSQSMEQTIGGLVKGGLIPGGSILHFDPKPDLERPSDEKIRAFDDFCQKKGIKLIVSPTA